MENRLSRAPFFRRIMGLVRGDLRNIGRDPILLAACVSPFLITAAVRFFVPFLRTLIERHLSFDVLPHYPFIVSVAILLSPMMFGTIIGFLIVDERDENILVYFAVTPLSKAGYLLYRLAFPMVTGALSVFLVTGCTALTDYNPVVLTPVAVLAALEAPLFVLFLGAFASNKVEALTLSKGLGLLDFVPVAGYLAPAPWHLLAGLLPPYWVSKAFLAGHSGDWPAYAFYLAGGFLVHAVFIALLLRTFTRRIS